MVLDDIPNTPPLNESNGNDSYIPVVRLEEYYDNQSLRSLVNWDTQNEYERKILLRYYLKEMDLDLDLDFKQYESNLEKDIYQSHYWMSKHVAKPEQVIQYMIKSYTHTDNFESALWFACILPYNILCHTDIHANSLSIKSFCPCYPMSSYHNML